VLDEFGNAAFIKKLMFLLGLRTLIGDGDRDTLVEEGLFAQALRKLVEAELARGEDFRIGFESDLRAALLRGAGLLEIRGGNAAIVFLLIHAALAPDLHAQLFGQEIDDRGADAMQTARNFISVSV